MGRIGATIWCGLVLLMMGHSFIRILPALPGAMQALVTWPGILALPIVLCLALGAIGAVVFFAGMIVMAWRKPRD